MKLTSFALLLFLILLCSVARAQGPSDQTIARLKDEITRREVIDRDENTPSDLKATNRRILDQRRNELVNAIQARIAAVQKYLETLGPAITAEEKRSAQDSLTSLSATTDGLAKSSAPDSRSAIATRSEASGTSKAANQQSVYASFLRNKDNAASNDGSEAASAADAPFTITSPTKKTTAVAEIEVEVALKAAMPLATSLDVVLKDKDGKEVDKKKIAFKANEKTGKPAVVTLKEGTNTIVVSQGGQFETPIEIAYTPTSSGKPAAAAAATTADSTAAPRFIDVPSCDDDRVFLAGTANAKYQVKVNGTEVKNPDGTTPQQAAADGLLVVPLSKLKFGDMVQVYTVATDGTLPSYIYSRVENCVDPLKGHPVGFLFGGVVLSQEASQFSQSDPFFGFTAGYDSKVRGLNYRDNQGKSCKVLGTNCVDFGPATKEWRWHLRFQGIFTADGRAATGQTAPTAPTSAAPTTFSFIASRKAFDIETHGWIDLWTRNIFTIGPYAAWGASTVLSKNETANTTVTNGSGQPVTQIQSDNDMKQYREVGAHMTINMFSRKVFLESIIGYGHYEAFQGLDQRPTTLAASAPFRANDTSKRFIGKLRIFPEGLKTTFGGQIEGTPMFGVDLNAGTGPDQIKFFTGYAIRIGAIQKPAAAASESKPANSGTTPPK